MGKPTIEATAEDLDEYIAAMWDRDLSVVTIATRVKKLKTYFDWCVSRRYLDHSPAASLMKPKPESLCSGPMSQATFKLLLASTQRWADSGKPCDLAILLFIGDTGCRAGELCKLEIQDVDLEECKAEVDGKTGKRTVHFTEPTAKAIQAWLKVRPQNEHSNLFLSMRLEAPLTPNGLRQILHRHALRAHIDARHNPHAIRHMVGQTWLDNGANLVQVKEKLGHTDIRTTAMFYSHQDDQGRAKAATEQFSIVSQMT